jgi:hypothetical protein
MEGAASTVTHQLQRDLRGSDSSLESERASLNALILTMRRASSGPHMALALLLVFFRLRIASCYSSSDKTWTTRQASSANRMR